MIQKLIGQMRFEGHTIYDRPYQLNIVGVRSNNVKANSFDDELHVFYRIPEGKWQHHVFTITTDPGTYWLKNPIAPAGTALMKAGQYKDAYGLALHQGKYQALCQIHKPVKVIRDYDRNATLDFLNGKEEYGMFGINIHRARQTGSTGAIDRYSAGCQVFQNSEDFTLFMQLCKAHRVLHGNIFTYTLLDFRAKRRQFFRRITYGVTAGSASTLGYLLYNRFFKSKQ